MTELSEGFLDAPDICVAVLSEPRKCNNNSSEMRELLHSLIQAVLRRLARRPA